MPLGMYPCVSGSSPLPALVVGRGSVLQFKVMAPLQPGWLELSCKARYGPSLAWHATTECCMCCCFSGYLHKAYMPRATVVDVDIDALGQQWGGSTTCPPVDRQLLIEAVCCFCVCSYELQKCCLDTVLQQQRVCVNPNCCPLLI